MKKTLITLMALAGVAMAQDYTVTESWAIDFGTEFQGGYEITGTLNNKGTFWDVSDYAVAGGVTTASNHRPHLAGGVYGSWDDDFQFSITLTLGENISASNGWPVFASLAGNGKALRFGPYTNAGNYVSLDGDLSKDGDNQNFTTTVEGGGTYTITLTKIGTSLTLAVDGQDVSFGTLNDGVSGNITDISLGGDTGSSYRINETVHSISYGLVTVTPSTPSVPEPATATLSLLALAGLAARRRRK